MSTYKKILLNACAFGLIVPTLATETDWFNGGIGEGWPTSASGGSWANAEVAQLVPGESSSYYLDITNAATELTFTANDSKELASDDVAFETRVKFTPYDVDDLPSLDNADVKAGLTVVQDESGNLSWRVIVYNDGYQWAEATGTDAFTNDYAQVKVSMASRKVTYKIAGTTLKVGEASAFELPSGAQTIQVAGYQGIGQVSELKGVVQEAPWTGEGTEDSPYLVDATGLEAFKENWSAKYATAWFKLTDNATLGEGWAGIGNADVPFRGHFIVESGTYLAVTGDNSGNAFIAVAGEGAMFENITVYDAPFVGQAVGAITFKSCAARVSASTEPTYDYAFVLSGNEDASVTFDEIGDVRNQGPTMLRPMPDGLTTSVYLGWVMEDEFAGEMYVEYLLGTLGDMDYYTIRYEAGVTNLLLQDNGMDYVPLCNDGEKIAIDHSLVTCTNDPVQVEEEVELNLKKTDLGDGVTLYEATTEAPSTEVQITFDTTDKNLDWAATEIKQGDTTIKAEGVDTLSFTVDKTKDLTFTHLVAATGYFWADGTADKTDFVIASEIPEGTYSSLPTPNIAEAKIALVGSTTYYPTLKAALDSEDGDTVTLNTDVTLTENLTIAQGKIVETGGKTLTINAGVTNTLYGEFYFDNYTELVNNGAFVIDNSEDVNPKVVVGTTIIGNDETAAFIKYSKGAVMTFAGGNCTVTGTIEAKGVGEHGHMFLLGDKDAKITADQGNVPANKVGLVDSLTANYEVAYAEGAYSAKAKTISVTGVSLDVTATNLTVGSSFTLTATVAPENATVKTVTWSSDAEAVATVTSEGVVEAVAAGTATITVTTTDGEFQATCTVTVTAAPEPEKPDPTKPAEYNDESSANAAADAINNAATTVEKAALIGDPFTGISDADKQTYAGYVQATVTAGEGEKAGKYLVSLELNEAGETQLLADTKAGVEAIELADVAAGTATSASFKGTVGMWYNLFSGAAVDDVTTGSTAVQCTSATEDMEFSFTKPEGSKGFFQTKAGLSQADVTTK